MIALFQYKFKKDPWAQYLSEDMKQAEVLYRPYAVYFQKLATIRHDFANYMQSIPFFRMDETAATEGKRMKQHIVVLIDELMEMTYKEMERKYLEKKSYDRCPSFQDYEKMDVVLSMLWKSWFLKRGYYEEMYKEVPRMYMILRKMKEQLSYSMDPDERECEDMLAWLDSFKNKTNVEDPVLAALIYDIDMQCRAQGIMFHYKTEVPETFETEITDVYHIYDTLLRYALNAAKRCNSQKGQEIRFRTASQYGLWHLYLECPPGASVEDKGFFRLLKKYKITYKYKCMDGRTQIDLIR